MRLAAQLLHGVSFLPRLFSAADRDALDQGLDRIAIRAHDLGASVEFTPAAWGSASCRSGACTGLPSSIPAMTGSSSCSTVSRRLPADRRSTWPPTRRSSDADRGRVAVPDQPAVRTSDVPALSERAVKECARPMSFHAAFAYGPKTRSSR